jgi:hypothetical protein
MLPIIAFYLSIISNGNVSPLVLQDYVIAQSIHSGIDSQTMKKIAKCESGFKQFKPNGEPLISPTHDVGLMQINQIHWNRAKSLGLDVFNSPVDNFEMAKIIYKEQGFKAWTCYNQDSG